METPAPRPEQTIPQGAGIDPARQEAIRRVRRLATGILIGLSVVFAMTFLVADPPGWLLLIRAMAEAGMVGGIADWFAVEALFRHPLGLRIPHTALLPRNQKRAAGNIAQFIDAYFLVPDQLMANIRRIQPVHMVAEWLSRRENSALVAGQLSGFLRLVLRSRLRQGLEEGARGAARGMLVNSVDSRALAHQVSGLVKISVESSLMDDILSEIRDVLDRNRDRVRALVQDRSRWWIASAVDERVVRVLVDGILSVVDELRDRDAALRHEFDASIRQFVDEFEQSGRIAQIIDEGRRDYAGTPAFAEAVDGLVATIFKAVEKGLGDEDDGVTEAIAEALERFANTLLADSSLQEQLNERLLEGAEAVIAGIRPAIAAYITRVISEWDSTDLVARMEAEVGRDLQFIRINGAVLGAIVGGVLFLATHIFVIFQ